MLVSLFNFFFFSFYFYFLYLDLVLGLEGHYDHTVTLDDMVTVTVASHKVTEKNIKGSGKIMSYNMCKTHGYLG